MTIHVPGIFASFAARLRRKPEALQPAPLPAPQEPKATPARQALMDLLPPIRSRHARGAAKINRQLRDLVNAELRASLGGK